MPMKNPFSMLLSRLGVGRKLMLIYLLDLCAVIFVSGLLIHGKYIAIHCDHKELAGNAYIAALRQPLLETAAIHGVPSLPHDRSVLADAVRTGESDFVEAFAGSSDGRLKNALDPQRARLLASIERVQGRQLA